MTKDVVYMVTPDWRDRVRPSINSMLANGGIDRVYVLTYGKFEHEDKRVVGVNVLTQEYIRHDSPNWSGTRFSSVVLMRACLHRLFPSQDMILSIDSDTIVQGDLSMLWELMRDHGQNCYLMAAKEPTKSKGGNAEQFDLYVNTGVAMLNLKKLRDGMGDRIIEALNTRRFMFVEQDAFNEFCQGHILEMPARYNSCAFVEPHRDVVIRHYAATRYWWLDPLVRGWEKVDTK